MKNMWEKGNVTNPTDTPTPPKKVRPVGGWVGGWVGRDG